MKKLLFFLLSMSAFTLNAQIDTTYMEVSGGNIYKVHSVIADNGDIMFTRQFAGPVSKEYAFEAFSTLEKTLDGMVNNYAIVQQFDEFLSMVIKEDEGIEVVTDTSILASKAITYAGILVGDYKMTAFSTKEDLSIIANKNNLKWHYKDNVGPIIVFSKSIIRLKNIIEGKSIDLYSTDGVEFKSLDGIVKIVRQ